MIIIILILEGADLVGKTSVAKEMSRITGIPQTSIWIDLRTPKPAVVSVSKTLRLVAQSTKLNIIFDRSFMSEYVYGAILGRDISYIPELIKEWGDLKDCYLIVISATDEVLSQRYLKRGDDYVNIDKIIKINEQYKKLKEQTSSFLPTYEFDSSNISIEKLSLNILDTVGYRID